MMQRKIIHIDMDCFYAAIEIRDNPSLKNKPVAVGGSAERRGVLCTCNYIARHYGIHSAMPTAYAKRLCQDLVILPVNMPKYKSVAQNIQAIFREFTPLVEPLALDEAYLDVSEAPFFSGSATRIAQAICQKILKTEALVASAGVAPNKFLAKIASGWKKPNGFFVITPDEVSEFVRNLPIKSLFGVGKVTAEKLHRMKITTCADLQALSLFELMEQFGKMGLQLYQQSRGLDERKIEPNRIRKSLSVEETFVRDIHDFESCEKILRELYDKLLQRIEQNAKELPIKNQYLKIKYSNFKSETAEISSKSLKLDYFFMLLKKLHSVEKPTIRLLGIGVHFQVKEQQAFCVQTSLFD